MNPILITGLLAALGALLYAIGDVLLLGGKPNPAGYPNLAPYEKLLSGAEKMASLPPSRMMWGAFAGIYATPLVIAGFWQVYLGLEGAAAAARLTAVILFATASVLGAFVHGSFFYAGEYVRALNDVSAESRGIIAGMFDRHRRVLIIGYAPLLLIVLAASLLFSFAVSGGGTRYPAWMAAVNPVTLTAAWLALKQILPVIVRAGTEGAGFNIAYLVFFVCSTAVLWQA